MIRFNNIHDTVLKVSAEAKRLIPAFQRVQCEKKLLQELILCILSSQEKYEVSLAIVKSIEQEKIITIPKNKQELTRLCKRLATVFNREVEFEYNNKQFYRRLRFSSKKAQYVVCTLQNLYLNGQTITKILKDSSSSVEAREKIMKYSKGIGPKQASMFLRNIGYHSEFAVLDKHVVEYMKMMGLTKQSLSAFSNIKIYAEVEEKLKQYASAYQINLVHLDLAIWTTMRTLKNNGYELNGYFSIRRD